VAERSQGPRIRLLPVAIFVAGAMLSVKVGSIWHGVELAVGAPTQAESKPAGTPASAAKPGAKPDEAKKAAPKAGGKADAKDAAPAKSEDDDDVEPSRLGANAPALTEEEIAILEKLAARREELDKRERDLDLRQTLLQAAEKRIDGKLADLKKIQGTVAELIKKHDDEEETKLKSLVKMYETMKPKEAAQIFEKLDMPVVLDVVERMKEQKSGPILAKMHPEKAQEVTAALAERRKLPKVVQ